ncbi:MAG: ABC transporter ATP-binding protein [Alphaproteobacteria bacterium]|nr:ABC transporter ATP-binding protein [Alphaproteobacteria bacterium]
MLSLKDVTVRYGLREALSGISFEVGEGELVTLIGTNGAGKTTCLKAISGLLKPSAGRIEFRGARADGLAPHALVGLGMAHVPEGRLLFPDMTVLDHLELGAMRAAADAKPYDERLEWCFSLFPRLKERRGQKGGTLSGGEQQMVAIARGLMSSPRLLMLDEPSLGLAPVVVDLLADVIAQLHKGGLTVLLVEQRVDLALKLADHGCVLETGRIILRDRAAALLENPMVKQAYLGA